MSLTCPSEMLVDFPLTIMCCIPEDIVFYHSCENHKSNQYLLSKIWKFLVVWITCKSRCSAAGITSGFGLNDWGVEVLVPVGSRIFTYPYCPDWLQGPPSLLSSGSFLRSKVASVWSSSLIFSVKYIAGIDFKILRLLLLLIYFKEEFWW
jgi:hypothetical protein